MRVYLAARYSRREEMLVVARTLRDAGVGVTSRWITGQHERYGVPDTVCANDDIEDIGEAHALIAFTEPADTAPSRGGRHVEAGMALAYCRPLLVVGPVENIFYNLAFARFETVDELAGALVRDAYFGATWRGICASCGCTEETACSGIGQEPCAWVDERQIYCTRCVIDRQVAKPTGGRGPRSVESAIVLEESYQARLERLGRAAHTAADLERVGIPVDEALAMVGLPLPGPGGSE